MKSYYTKTKLPQYFLSLIVVTTLLSCGAAQTVSGNDDGIYADDTEKPQRKVVQMNERDYNDYNENYFTKEVERLDNLNGTDIITDIESYSSEDYSFDNDSEDELVNENQILSNREPWGFDNNSDVVININTFGNGYNWGVYGPYWNSFWGDPFWSYPWRGRFGNRWGYYDPYWHPFHGPYNWNAGIYLGFGGIYDPFCPPGYYRYGRNRAYRGYGAYRNFRFRNNRGIYRTAYRSGIYNRRGAFASTNRRYARNNTRATSRRSSNVYRRNNRSINRSNRSISRNRNNSTIRRNSNSRSINRNSRSIRSRSYNNNSSRRNNRSYSPNRNSSRRSSANRSSSSRRSYSTRSSSSRSRSYSPSRSSSSRSSGSSSRSSSRRSSRVRR